MIAPAFEFF